MRRSGRTAGTGTILGALAVLLASPGVGPAAAPGLTVRTGKQVTLLGDRALGLREFPDGAIAVVSRSPKVRLLVSSGVSSFLVEGRRLDALDRAERVLAPGKPGEFDNGYAGISGAWRDPAGRLYAFYHAEDHEGLGRFGNNVPGFYCRAALAVSDDDGRAFTKMGPVVTSAQVKEPGGPFDQGCGELCVVAERDGCHLYMYYADHSRVGGRGVQICLARAPIEGGAPAPGTWKKYHQGAFGEDGLGGQDTPVVSAGGIPADATFPHVTWSRALGVYVMVFNVVAYLEHPESGKERRPGRSGIYWAWSADGISWSEPRQLLRAYSMWSSAGEDRRRS